MSAGKRYSPAVVSALTAILLAAGALSPTRATATIFLMVLTVAIVVAELERQRLRSGRP